MLPKSLILAIGIFMCAIAVDLAVAAQQTQQALDGGTSVSSPEIEEALKFSSNVIATVEEYLAHKLPPMARNEGDIILLDTREGLEHCESQLQGAVDIGRYKACCGEQLSKAMIGFSELQALYRPYGSGAARLTFF